jgi:D-arabinose 1-dehydrogenase-like Zn-dependent alcohol dehydrogenase
MNAVGVWAEDVILPGREVDQRRCFLVPWWPSARTQTGGAVSLIAKRRQLAGSLISGIRETQEMLDFCGEHNITSDIELIPIQKINEAYDRLVKSDVKYRFVIDMKSLG